MHSHSLRIVLAALVALGVGGCSSPVEREAKALKKGGEYFVAGNWDKARVEYRNALQIVPNDGEARFRNGLVLEKLGQFREAAQFFIGALEVKPEHREARVRLARIYVGGGVPEKALELVKVGLEMAPNDAGLLGMRAAARARLKDTAGALQDAEAAARLDPRDEYVIAILAGLYSTEGRLDKARGLLQGAVRDIPGTIDLRLALAQLELSQSEPQRAEALLRDVIKLQPQESVHRLRLARFLALQGQTDAAERVLTEARQASPKDGGVRTAMIEFLAANRGRAAAEAELRRMVAAEPDEVDTRFVLASFYMQGKEPPKAEAILQEIIKSQHTKPAGLTARVRLAAIRLAAGDAATASTLIAEVLDKSPRDTDALLLRGNLRLSKGDAKGAIEDLRAASRDLPNSQPILRALARAHLRNEEPALAEESLRRAVDVDASDVSSRTDLIDLLQRSARSGEAATMLAQLAKERPKDVAIQSATLQAALASHDYPLADSVVAAVRAIAGERARGALFAGMVAEAQGHEDAALKAYRESLDAQPTAQESLIQATRLLIARKHVPEAFRLLDEVAAKAPGYALPATLKGDQLLSERNFSAAEEAYRAALVRAPRWWTPQRGLAYVRVGRGDVAGAVTLLQSAAPQVDEPWRLQAAAAQLLDLSGRAEEAITAYDKALASSSDSAALANNLAMLLVNHRTDGPSLKRAAQLTAGFASAPNPQLLDTYGWVRYRNGDVAVALAALEKAGAAAPKAAIVKYHLGVVQDAAGQQQQAIASLKAAIAGGEKFPGAEDAAVRLAKLTAH
ncbi:MAG: tetratricopeptide repeat protein [Pseudomonadota bacterium]